MFERTQIEAVDAIVMGKADLPDRSATQNDVFIDVGANIGAKLQTDQAAADLRVAEARAEERRAMAVAVEQEMKAKAQEARAKVIEAEAEIPKAIAAAFVSGNLGIMDYYKMQNVQADTEMRNSISGSGKSTGPAAPSK